VSTVTNTGANGVSIVTRTWQATDACGNSAQCSQSVSVQACLSLGNRVFADSGAGGGIPNNGLQDGTEPGIGGVLVRLFAADVAGNPTGPSLGSQITDTDGWYRFDNLRAGTYVPVVDFNNSPVLTAGGYVSSTGFTTDTTLAGDRRDHGKDTPLGPGSVLPGGIAGVAATLGAGLQPLGEATASGQGAHGPTGDANDNLTLDFGFVPPPPNPTTYSLGNRVFLDNGAGGGTENDGRQDGTEPGIAGVVVRIFFGDAAGNPTGPVLDTQTTDTDGWYRFDNLPAGTFVVVVDMQASFLVLNGLASSTGVSLDTTITGDLYDHGRDVSLGLGTVLPGGIAGVPVTLGLNLQPLGEVVSGTGAGAHGPTGDANDNLVMDFGFHRPPVTLASIRSVTGTATAGVVTVRWVTVAEVGTVAYDLQRELPDGSWLTINDDPVFALNSTIGATYDLVDSGARARLSYQYRIIEYLDDGATRLHGPYPVAVIGEPGTPVRITSYELTGGQLRLTWAGGAGSYMLERSPSVGADADWVEVPLTTPSDTSALVPMEGPTGFFRVFRLP